MNDDPNEFLPRIAWGSSVPLLALEDLDAHDRAGLAFPDPEPRSEEP